MRSAYLSIGDYENRRFASSHWLCRSHSKLPMEFTNLEILRDADHLDQSRADKRIRGVQEIGRAGFDRHLRATHGQVLVD